jgi:hypothetical protein
MHMMGRVGEPRITRLACGSDRLTLCRRLTITTRPRPITAPLQRVGIDRDAAEDQRRAR